METANSRAEELGKIWRTYVDEQGSENNNMDFSLLYDTEDRSALKKAIRRL